jgi:hypothetical protein
MRVGETSALGTHAGWKGIVTMMCHWLHRAVKGNMDGEDLAE